MAFINNINSCIEQLHELVYAFEDIKEDEIISESFFEEAQERFDTLKENLSVLEELNLKKEQALTKNKKEEEEVVVEEVIIPEPTPSAQEPERVEKVDKQKVGTSLSLEEKIAKTIYADLRKGLSFNDRYRYLRELFKNDKNLMDETLNNLNSFTSLEDALTYINKEFDWNWETETAADFKELLKRRLS